MTTYEIQIRDKSGNWVTDLVGDNNEFRSELAAEAAFAELVDAWGADNSYGDEIWNNYRIVEIEA